MADEAHANLAVLFKKAGIGKPLAVGVLLGRPDIVTNMTNHMDLISSTSEEAMEALEAKISALREAKAALIAFVRDFAASSSS